MVIQASQGDLESRYELILKPIRDLTKNWDVDLASQLEQYLEELDTITISFDGGKTTMNFAEAALLIQGSTSVYSKKVEYLYALVHQVLDHLASKKKMSKGTAIDGEGNDQDVEENFRDTDEKFLTLDDTKVHNNVDYKGDLDSKNELQMVPETPLTLVPMTEGIKGETPLMSRTGEVLGSRHDFKVNTCHLQPMGLLNLDLSHMSMLEKSIFTKPSSTPLHPRPPAAAVGIQDGMMPDTAATELTGEDDNQVDEGLQDMSLHSDGGLPEMPDLDEDPLHLPQQQGEDGDEVSDRMTTRPKRAVLALKPQKQVENPLTNIDPHLADNRDRPFKKRKTFKVPPTINITNTDAGKKRKRNKQATETTLKPISEFCREIYYSTTQHFPSNKLKVPDFPELERLYWLEFQRRRTKLRRDKKILEDQGVTEEIEEEENNEEARVYDDDGGDDNEDIVDFHLPDAGVDLAELIHMSQGPQGPPDPYLPAHSDDSENLPVVGSYEELVKHHVEAFLAGAQEYAQITDLARRVADWEEKIKPRLQLEEVRGSFDIHAYGTTILDALQKAAESVTAEQPNDKKKNEPIPFRKVVENKEPYEVCRLFLASLQLANNYNLEIGCHGVLEEAVDSMTLRLLSTKRHHEELGDYLAPSLQG